MLVESSVKISVIIPVYNVEEYLGECLDSVISQTLKEIEIICVDDGSPDNSIKILNRYAEEDERIKIISQKNLGLSGARNSGIKIATGRYIYFLDSDDVLHTRTAFEEMLIEMDRDELDILSFDYRYIGMENRGYVSNIPVDIIFTGKEYLKHVGVHVEIWSRLFRKQLLEEIGFSFILGYSAEDAEAIPRLSYAAHRVKHIDKQFLSYRVRENSIMTSKCTQIIVDGLALTAKAYWVLSQQEEDADYSRFLFLAGLEFLMTSFEKNYSVGDIKVTKKKYEEMYTSLGLTWFDKVLLRNEETYIENVMISGNRKKSKFFVYLLRRVRIVYFKKIRKF